jgi:hypothetical protein
MSLKTVNTALTIVGILFIGYIGLSYVLTPETMLLVEALTPLGDMTNVLAHHGSTTVAFSVHGLTAALVILTGLLTLRETRKAAAAPVPTVAPVPALR